MPVVCGISINLTENDVFRRQEIRNSDNVRSSIKSIARELLKRKDKWLHPAVAYEIYPVTDVTPGYLVLKDGRRVNGPAVAAILKQAQEIAVVLCTIGPNLEEQVERYFQAGQSLRGFLLDGLGSAAIDALGYEAGCLIKSEVTSHGCTTGSPLSPGMYGWDIQELPNLLKLVPAEKIAVSLTSGGMMYPRKSIATVIGIGRNMARRKQAELCEYCDLRDTCRHRR
jgi:hypothetical protein